MDDTETVNLIFVFLLPGDVTAFLNISQTSTGRINKSRVGIEDVNVSFDSLQWPVLVFENLQPSRSVSRHQLRP